MSKVKRKVWRLPHAQTFVVLTVYNKKGVGLYGLVFEEQQKGGII